MGLLDWLTDGAGSAMGGSSPPPGMPPMQDPGTSDAMNPPPQVGDGGPPPSMLPPPASVPMPMARPPAADDPAALPPNAAPAIGTDLALPPNAAPSLAPPPSTASGPLGRMLGLDRNRESQVRGSLGAGLKAAGENAHKPGLAAFAGSMGSGIEGGKTASDKTTDQQQKYLTQAIAAAQAGNTAALNIARTKLALAQAKAAEEGDPAKSELTTARTRLATAQARKLEEGGEDALKTARTRLATAQATRLEEGRDKKDSPINSPEQLYLRAIGATNGDGKLSLLKNAYIQASKDGQQDTPAAKAAKKAYEDAYDQTRDAHLKTLGVDPKIASKIGKQPGFSADNPVPSTGLTQQKFDQLPVGAYFLNPKDGRLLIKQPPAGANPPPAASSPAAPIPAADDDE